MLRFLILITVLPPCKRTLLVLGKHVTYLGIKDHAVLGEGRDVGGRTRKRTHRHGTIRW